MANPPIKPSDRASDLLPNEREVTYEEIYHFYNRYKTWILLLILAILMGIFGWLVWRSKQGQVHQQASERLAAAQQQLSKSPNPETLKAISSLQAVVQEYPSSEAAAVASLTLGNIYSEQKEWDKAIQSYEFITKNHRNSPLTPLAILGHATILETTGKLEEALQMYQSVASAYPNSFSTPKAKFAAANLLEKMNRTDEARKVYEDLISNHPGSAWSEETSDRLKKLSLQLKNQAPNPSQPAPQVDVVPKSKN